MERLSANPRHFRLFLEYSTLGVRTPGIRRKVRGGLERETVDACAMTVINRKNRSQGHLDAKDPVSNQYVSQSHPFSSRRPRASALATPSSSS
jgi:hypothetical protein